MGVEVVVESTGLLHQARRRRQAPGGGRPQGDHQRAGHRARHHDLHGRERRTATTPSSTTSSRTPPARPTAWRRWPRCCIDGFGIERGYMTTTHAYTNDQQILDLPALPTCAGRAPPRSTSSRPRPAPPRRSGSVMPEMLGKLDGISMRVPVPDGSSPTWSRSARPRDDAATRSTRRSARPRTRGRSRASSSYSDDPLVSTRHRRLLLQLDLRLQADHGQRQPGQGRLLVRQRVGYSCRVVDLIAEGRVMRRVRDLPSPGSGCSSAPT